MTSYTLIGSASIVQVLSPTAIEDMVAATITTQPTGIVATTLVSQAAFVDGSASESLTALADGIESIIAQGKAVGGSGTSALDVSGLTQYFVTFEVAYNPPGAPAGTVKVDVDVPVGLLILGQIGGPIAQLADAEALIDTAYANLVALSGNPAPSGATSQTAVSPPPPQPATS